MQNLLNKALADNEIKISDDQLTKITKFVELLIKWNKVFNLTSITDIDEIIYKHIIDSLTVAPLINGKEILDVGTGAGFPGIPLAIIFPDKNFTLIDSNGKKTRFLNQAIIALGLNNVKAEHLRVEEFSADLKFDSIFSRAFSSLKQMLEQTQHLIAPEGQFLAMKGEYPKEELTKINKDFSVLFVRELTIRGLDAKRHLVSIVKGNP